MALVKGRMSMKKTKFIGVTILICAFSFLGGCSGEPDEEVEKYKYNIVVNDIAIEWPEEYLTLYEKCGTIEFENIKYVGKSKISIGNIESIGELIGMCKVYEEDVEIYSIKGILKEALVAVELDGDFYVYANENIQKPQTFGEFLEIYSLQEHLVFNEFSICERYEEKGNYKIDDDSPIWKILTECKMAEIEDTDDFFDEGDKNYLSFTATSEALGVYKRVVYISEDGYFATNILDFACTYYIGEEAALNIIKYAKDNSIEMEYEPYEQTVAGTVIEKGEGYVLIDDSSLCVNEQDGNIYKISTEDIRIRRCIELEDVQIGDVVVISYHGDIADGNEIVGAFSMSKGRREGKSIVISE